MKKPFSLMVSLLLSGCAGQVQPLPFQYDRYQIPSDLFRELGFIRNKNSHSEYSGKNIHQDDKYFEEFCASKNGTWTSHDNNMRRNRNPFLESDGSKGIRYDDFKMFNGKCTVDEKTLFEYHERSFVKGKSEGILIDRIIEEKYQQSIEERVQPW